jgi:hypothetical protein
MAAQAQTYILAIFFFSQNNYNLPSSKTLLFSALLHVLASTGSHH